MNRVVLLLLIIPVFLVFASIVDGYLPRELLGANPQDGIWGLAAVVTLVVYRTIIQKMQNAHLSNSLAIRVHNEQVKLLAVTTNAVAIGLLVLALIEPIKGNLQVSLTTAFWLVMAVLVHSVAQKILSFIQDEAI
ncbi:MAG: hypothetical protein K8F90_05490 [Hyphomicrobiales bacterium]|nr:hypothetical protein [Hyphomicrobiales bacterium]